MRPRTAILLIVLFVSPAVIYLLWPSDESRIRKLIKSEASAAEQEDIKAFMSGISFNYQDDYGLSYLLIKRLMERQFKVYEGIDVERRGLSISVGEGKARAELDVRVIAGEGEARGYYWGDSKEPVHMVLELEKNKAGMWFITKATPIHSSAPVPRMRH